MNPNTVKLSLDITNPTEFHNLGIELWLGKTKFFDSEISPGTHHVMHEFDSKDDEHYFKIKLKNKNKNADNEHTKINEAGEIVSDALISISNVCLDEIMIDQLMYEKAQYVHDGNGSKTIAVHQFYGDLGCNGYVQLKFHTPVYLWLLENM
jgi:hypothetical protein